MSRTEGWTSGLTSDCVHCCCSHKLTKSATHCCRCAFRSGVLAMLMARQRAVREWMSYGAALNTSSLQQLPSRLMTIPLHVLYHILEFMVHFLASLLLPTLPVCLSVCLSVCSPACSNWVACANICGCLPTSWGIKHFDWFIDCSNGRQKRQRGKNRTNLGPLHKMAQHMVM